MQKDAQIHFHYALSTRALYIEYTNKKRVGTVYGKCLDHVPGTGFLKSSEHQDNASEILFA
jgi:hypothetical protein